MDLTGGQALLVLANVNVASHSAAPDTELTTALLLCDKRRAGFHKSIINGVRKIRGPMVAGQTMSNE